jgi:hypothetical protein
VTISSPGSSVRATACASWKFSVDMFGPNATSPGDPHTRSAAASRPAATISPAAALDANAPSRFALASRMQATIAAITDSGTCEPPGPSRYATSPASAGNAARARASQLA